MKTEFEFVTGTASLCIFDPEVLKHRLHDSPDWWSDYFVEVEEVNQGNVIFAGLGADGRYVVTVTDEPMVEKWKREVTALLKCQSGLLFVGPGEDVTGGELEPTTRSTTGKIVSVAKTNCKVTIRFDGRSHILIQIAGFDGDSQNRFEDSICLG